MTELEINDHVQSALGWRVPVSGQDVEDHLVADGPVIERFPDRGLDRFQTDLEKDPMIGSVVGPTTILRMIRYIGAEAEPWPTDPAGLEVLATRLPDLDPDLRARLAAGIGTAQPISWVLAIAIAKCPVSLKRR